MLPHGPAASCTDSTLGPSPAVTTSVSNDSVVVDLGKITTTLSFHTDVVTAGEGPSVLSVQLAAGPCSNIEGPRLEESSNVR